jgi:hypothetical protein
MMACHHRPILLLPPIGIGRLSMAVQMVEFVRLLAVKTCRTSAACPKGRAASIHHRRRQGQRQ